MVFNVADIVLALLVVLLFFGVTILSKWCSELENRINNISDYLDKFDH